MPKDQSSPPAAAPRRQLEGYVRGLIADLEQLGVGDETRQVNGADVVNLLNVHLPWLRIAVAEPRG